MSIKGFKSKDGKIHKYDYDALENVPENSGYVKSVNGKTSDENGNVEIAVSGGSGDCLTSAQIAALDGMFKVCAFTKADVSAEYTAFKTAFGIADATLTGISAVYSGGNVSAGTSVDALTGIVVTANYSDGSKRTVTGYTLSGTIAEGENTITVAYEGMTTTFTVTGVAVGVELTSISATYSGGDVEVGTAVTDLTGVVVTAHYSDGSSSTVTGYTLSGTIAEGENTVTVLYGGMSTTFAVTGVIVYDGIPVTNYSVVESSYVKNNGMWEAGYYSAAYFEVLAGETYEITAYSGKKVGQCALVASGYSGTTTQVSLLDYVNNYTDAFGTYTTEYTVPQDGCLIVNFSTGGELTIIKKQ